MESTVSVGCIVHYVLPAGPSKGSHRPAVVVHLWPSGEYTGTVQLQVFTDSDEHGNYNDRLPQVMWATSVKHDENGEPGTWHWQERDE